MQRLRTYELGAGVAHVASKLWEPGTELFSSTKMPQLFVVVQVRRVGDKLTVKPDYEMGVPRPWHENKRARAQADTDHSL